MSMSEHPNPTNGILYNTTFKGVFSVPLTEQNLFAKNSLHVLRKAFYERPEVYLSASTSTHTADILSRLLIFPTISQ